jgi:hypothetical protein
VVKDSERKFFEDFTSKRYKEPSTKEGGSRAYRNPDPGERCPERSAGLHRGLQGSCFSDTGGASDPRQSCAFVQLSSTRWAVQGSNLRPWD